jgi:hypothetical protein
MFASLPLSLLFLLPFAQASFYDNPEFDLPPESGTPLDELQAKYGTDVSFPTVFFPDSFGGSYSTLLSNPLCGGPLADQEE